MSHITDRLALFTVFIFSLVVRTIHEAYSAKRCMNWRHCQICGIYARTELSYCPRHPLKTPLTALSDEREDTVERLLIYDVKLRQRFSHDEELDHIGALYLCLEDHTGLDWYDSKALLLAHDSGLSLDINAFNAYADGFLQATGEEPNAYGLLKLFLAQSSRQDVQHA